MALSPRDKLAAGMIRVVDPGKRKDGNSIGIAPYFGVLLRGLIRREISPEQHVIMEALGMPATLAVSRDGVLWWSPKFVASITSDELAGVLVHEAMHLALKHADRATALGIKPEPSNEMFSKARRWNWAGDLAINTDVRKFAALPKDGLFPEQFKFPEGLTAEVYYKLLEEWEKKQPKQPQGGQGSGQGQGAPGKGQPQAGVTGGHCGGCAQHPIPGEPDPTGKPGEGRSEAELERMRRATAEAVKDYASKRRGTVPSSLERWADEMLKPAKIPWRTKLARVIRGAVAYRSGSADLTWGKVSRRQAGVGFGVGRPVVPALHAPQPEVACVIDTSGSMGDEQLAEALSEVQGVLKAVGSNITLCICDAEVHGIKPIANIRQARSMMKGGGGTAMAPALEAVSQLKNKITVCVVVTDGYIDQPDEPGFHTIWAIVGGNKNFTMPYGDVVWVEDDA
jgi:predicted metal-dependent peptidase